MSDTTEEPVDIIVQAKGRAAFLRDRGEVKTPETLEALAARLAEVEAERDAALKREHDANVAAMGHQRRAEAAEAEVARLSSAAGAAGVLLDKLPPEHQCWAVMQDGIEDGLDVGDIMRAALRVLANKENADDRA